MSRFIKMWNYSVKQRSEVRFTSSSCWGGDDQHLTGSEVKNQVLVCGGETRASEIPSSKFPVTPSRGHQTRPNYSCDWACAHLPEIQVNLWWKRKNKNIAVKVRFCFYTWPRDAQRPCSHRGALKLQVQPQQRFFFWCKMAKIKLQLLKFWF